jgi:hypothetical protein
MARRRLVMKNLFTGISGGKEKYGIVLVLLLGLSPGIFGQTRHPFIISVNESSVGSDVIIHTDGIYVLEGLLNTTIYRYYGSKTSLVIPDSLGSLPVWKISARAFEPTLDTDIISTTITKGDDKKVVGVFSPRRTKLASVTLPKDLDEIGERAFANNFISRIVIPESVRKIGSAAFANNRISLITLMGQDVDIAGNSFENGFSVFYNGNGKKSGYYMYGSQTGWSYLSLGQFKRTGDFTFLLCTDGDTRIAALYSYNGKEKDIHIPGEVDGVPVTRIMLNAFYTDITGVSIPDSVTVIDNHAFSGNELEKVTLPSNLVSIGDNAFEDNKLVTIVIPPGVKTIGTNAFAGNKIGSVELGRSVTAIGDGAFQNNDLTELTIPNSVETIGASAFAGNQLVYVDLGSSLVSIGSGVFKNNKLEGISIPARVKSIGADAFWSNPITSIAIGGGVDLGNRSFDGEFKSYYDDCFKLPGLYYKGDMRDRWSGGFVSKPHLLMDAGFGLEAGFLSAPWEAAFARSFRHMGVDARLGFGFNFDLLWLNMSAIGIGGTKFGKGILGFYAGGMGELYLYDGFGLGFGGGVFYGSFEALDIEKMRTLPFLRGELIFRGRKHKFSFFGEYYVDERWGFGLLWHVDDVF